MRRRELMFNKPIIGCGGGGHGVDDIDISNIEFINLDPKLPYLIADRNLGAQSPEDIGLLFAWGELEGYTIEEEKQGVRIFDESHYKFYEQGIGYTKYTDTNNTLKDEDNICKLLFGSKADYIPSSFISDINNCSDPIDIMVHENKLLIHNTDDRTLVTFSNYEDTPCWVNYNLRWRTSGLEYRLCYVLGYSSGYYNEDPGLCYWMYTSFAGLPIRPIIYK